MSHVHHGHAHGGGRRLGRVDQRLDAAHPQGARRHDHPRHGDRPGGVVEGDEALEDIARLVGHAKPSTTAGYVKRLGRRPQSVAERAAAILDDYGRREGAE
jgi:hypothetical protein